MILNTILLIVTTFILYIGYSYLGLLMFFSSLIYEELKQWFYGINKSKGVYNEINNTWKVTFFIDGKKYNIIIPKEQLNIKKHRILAMSSGKNKTEKIYSFMGPLMNFWGFSVTPKHLGLDNELIIWTKGYRYIFPNSSVIDFDDKYIVVDTPSSSSSESENDDKVLVHK